MRNIGRYQIESELGRGAMGVVYRAVDPNIGRTVALKTMRLGAGQFEQGEMLLRFRNEAHAAGRMNHPNIVTVYDADECGGIFYIAMEYLEGETLQSLMARKKTLAVQQIVEIAKQVAAGLDYAHAMKVVHRDIKPANIMITGQNVVKIMDFGISKSMGSMTRTSQVLGTPYYMSPEQVMGRGLDGRGDLFSFGVVLYEMATGGRPFAGEDVPTIIYKIINESPIPPCDLQIGVPRGLSTAICRCLAKNPNDRYQTGAQLAADIENYRSLRPASAQATTASSTSLHGQQESTSANLRTMPVQAMATQPVFREGGQAAGTQAGARPAGVTQPTAPARRSATTNKMVPVAAAILLVASLGILYFWQQRRNPAQSSHVIESDQSPRAMAAPDRAASEPTPAQPAGNSAQPVVTVGATDKGQASARPGRVAIRLTSNPRGVLVRFDGHSSPSWLTPLTLDDVAPGAHDVVFTKDGYSTETRRIEIAPKSPPYHVDLVPETTAVSVMTDPPGASIEIDGTDTGKVTPAQIPVAPGQHAVVVRLAGYQPGQAKAQVDRGQIYTLPQQRLIAAASRDSGDAGGAGAPSAPALKATMANGNGLIDFVTDPPGASIFVEGHRANLATPAHNQFPPGDYSIELRKTGYKPVQQVVHVDAGQISSVNKTLVPE